MCFNIEKELFITLWGLYIIVLVSLGFVYYIVRKKLSEKNKRLVEKINLLGFTIMQIIYGMYLFRCN